MIWELGQESLNGNCLASLKEPQEKERRLTKRNKEDWNVRQGKLGT